MKDDAIAQLSDQLMRLAIRLQERGISRCKSECTAFEQVDTVDGLGVNFDIN